MTEVTLVKSVVALILLLNLPAWSQPRLPWGPTDQEVTMLPEECRIHIKGTDEQRKLMMQQLPGLMGITHYCAGMNFMNRARFNSRDKSERRFNLTSAIGEFDYVLKHSAPDAKGLEMIRSQQAQARTMLKIR